MGSCERGWVYRGLASWTRPGKNKDYSELDWNSHLLNPVVLATIYCSAQNIRSTGHYPYNCGDTFLHLWIGSLPDGVAKNFRGGRLGGAR